MTPVKPNKSKKLIQPLTLPPAFERGPKDLKPTSTCDIQEPQETIDYTPLNSVMARQWKSGPYADPILALEVIFGPYTGVVFSFSNFEVLPTKMENGMVPARFETKVLKSPVGFEKDEAFDLYCSELLLAWLTYIGSNEVAPFLRSESAPHIH